MDIKKEFDDLVENHICRERAIDYSDPNELAEYLSEFLPIEGFLKQLFEMNRNIRHALWDFDELYSEKSGFRDPSSISVARHFRYDTHIEHSHNFFQLNYIYAGSGNLTVGDESIAVENGDFLLIAPKVSHNIEIFNDECVLIKYYIRCSTFERTFFEWLSENNILSEFFRRSLFGGETGKYILFHTCNDNLTRELVLKLYAELMGHKDYYRIVSESLLTELFCRLVRENMENVKTELDMSHGVTIGALIGYIQINYRKITLDDAAAWSGYSKAHLCRLIQRSTGRTFTDILNETRINSAAVLLTSTDMNIATVGYHVGYNSYEHFYRMFKRYMKMTPGEYCERAECDKK